MQDEQQKVTEPTSATVAKPDGKKPNPPAQQPDLQAMRKAFDQMREQVRAVDTKLTSLFTVVVGLAESVKTQDDVLTAIARKLDDDKKDRSGELDHAVHVLIEQGADVRSTLEHTQQLLRLVAADPKTVPLLRKVQAQLDAKNAANAGHSKRFWPAVGWFSLAVTVGVVVFAAVLFAQG